MNDNRDFAATCFVTGCAIIPAFALFVLVFFIHTMVAL